MYKLDRSRKESSEEKVAKKIANTLADFTLDIEAVGRYLVTANPFLLYTRTMEVFESAKFQHENQIEYDKKWGYKDDVVRK
jgi:hypothetical protein